jgi:hypothetical protein
LIFIARRRNQTSASNPKLMTSDIRKNIGKATDALKVINDMDNKLLVSMSSNPRPMLEKSTGIDNNNNN